VLPKALTQALEHRRLACRQNEGKRASALKEAVYSRSCPRTARETVIVKDHKPALHQTWEYEFTTIQNRLVDINIHMGKSY
jgi:hypothetical protein